MAATPALVALAERWPDVAPRAALQALLLRHGGNASAAAREIAVDRRWLLEAVDSLDLRGWLEETWPARERGGAPRLVVGFATEAEARDALGGGNGYDCEVIDLAGPLGRSTRVGTGYAALWRGSRAMGARFGVRWVDDADDIAALVGVT